MMLGASSDAIDGAAEVGAVMLSDAHGPGDAGVVAGAELLAFTDAVHRLDDSLGAARNALVEAVGRSGMLDAAVTAAIFRSLNIAADTSGIRVDDAWVDPARELMASIGTGRFRTAANSFD